MRLLITIILAVSISGCAFIPGYWSSLPDSQKVSNMMLHGGSKSRVRSGFGVPADTRLEGDREIWTYPNREGGRTIEFYFDLHGRLVRTLWGKE